LSRVPALLQLFGQPEMARAPADDVRDAGGNRLQGHACLAGVPASEPAGGVGLRDGPEGARGAGGNRPGEKSARAPAGHDQRFRRFSKIQGNGSEVSSRRRGPEKVPRSGGTLGATVMPGFRVSPGVDLHYLVDDFTDPWVKSDAILLLHGNNESGVAWYGWVPHLARRYR